MTEDSLMNTASLTHTSALRRVWPAVTNWSAAEDLLFLERWEMDPLPGTAAALRVGQIRRANPELAAEIRAEVSRNRAG